MAPTFSESEQKDIDKRRKKKEKEDEEELKKQKKKEEKEEKKEKGKKRQKTFSGYLSKNGIVKFLLLIYAICIIYMLLYMVYVLYKFIRFLLKYPELIFKQKQWYTQIDESNFFPFAILDRIAFYTFLAALCLFCALSAVFLLLYLIWAGARKAGMAWLLEAIIFVFRDCKNVGLFSMFDKIFDMIGGSGKASKAAEASGKFLGKFFQDAVNILAPGNSINIKYMDAFNEYTSGSCSNNRKVELVDMMSKEFPILKVNYVDSNESPEKTGSYMDVTELNNCFKYNTIREASDDSTIDTLKIIITNEMAKERCLADFKKKSGNVAGNASSGMLAGLNNIGKHMQDEFL